MYKTKNTVKNLLKTKNMLMKNYPLKSKKYTNEKLSIINQKNYSNENQLMKRIIYNL